jgi:hypothetical protein
MIKIESAQEEYNELVNKRKSEIINNKIRIMHETISKAKFLQKFYIITEYSFYLIGYFIIGYFIDWMLVVGLIVLNFGRNLTTKRLVDQNKDNIWKEIWKL